MNHRFSWSLLALVIDWLFSRFSNKNTRYKCVKLDNSTSSKKLLISIFAEFLEFCVKIDWQPCPLNSRAPFRLILLLSLFSAKVNLKCKPLFFSMIIWFMSFFRKQRKFSKTGLDLKLFASASSAPDKDNSYYDDFLKFFLKFWSWISIWDDVRRR